MTVPASRTDRTPICGRSHRAHIRCTVSRISRKAASNQIWNPSVSVSRRLNVSSGHGWIVNYLLLEIVGHNVEGAAGQQIGRGIIVARLGELPVVGCAGKVS